MTVFVNLSCVTDSDVSRGFLYRLGRWSARHAVAVILIWVSLVVGAVIGNRALGGVYADNFALPGTSAQQAADLLQAHRPSAGGQGGLIVFAVSSGSLTSQRSAIEQSMTAVRELPDVLGASDPLAPTAIAKSGQIAYSSAHFSVNPQTLGPRYLATVNRAVAPARAAGVTVNYGGQLGQAAKLKNKDPRSEEIGIIAAFIVLLIGFGSVYAARTADPQRAGRRVRWPVGARHARGGDRRFPRSRRRWPS